MRPIYFFLPDFPECSTGGIIYLQKIFEYAVNHSEGINIFGKFRFAKTIKKSFILRLITGFYYIFNIPKKSIIVLTNTELSYFLLPKLIFGFWKKHFYYMIVCHLTSKEKSKWYRDFLEHFFIRKADYITTISDTTLESLYANKLIDGRIEIIQPGIEYKPLENLPVKDDNTYKLLYVGSIEERKGLIYTIESLNKLKNRNFILNVVGRVVDSDYFEMLKEKISEYNLNDKINFLGKVSNEKLQELYKISHLFVFLSIWEGYGMVVAEASSFGVPVIATNLPSLKPILDDGYNGYYVELNNINNIADKIDLLINNKDLRKEMSINALKKASTFVSWDVICSKHLNIFNRIR